jgi:hypothetical protein
MTDKPIPDDEIEIVARQLADADSEQHWTWHRFTAADVIRALDAVRDAKSDTEWQTMETAPKDGTVILGYHRIWKSWKSILWREGEIEGCPWLETGYLTAWPPNAFSHWMPLPTPPKG